MGLGSLRACQAARRGGSTEEARGGLGLQDGGPSLLPEGLYGADSPRAPSAGRGPGLSSASRPQVWQNIEDAEWRPQTYLELEGLPCILIFSGMDPHGESLPRCVGPSAWSSGRRHLCRWGRGSGGGALQLETGLGASWFPPTAGGWGAHRLLGMAGP